MRRSDRRAATALLGLTVFLRPACTRAPDRTRFATPKEAATALLEALQLTIRRI